MNSGALSNTSDLVRFSRAGDAFHYRWAARRCLRLVNPSTSLKLVSIEGSKERKQAGEYVIDVAEYYDDLNSKRETVAYFQLKHSTKQLDSPFTLSGLKGAIEGFADRYRALNEKGDGPEISHFTIITNRPIAKDLKGNVEKLVSGRATDKTFAKTIGKYTKLEGVSLREFCSLLELNDGEGNYIEQRFDLHVELSELMAGVVDNSQIDTLISLVSERALPDNDGWIVREDILKRLGATSDRELFPAPPRFEPLGDLIRREQHADLLRSIVGSENPVIIHAEGGVGKTVVCRQLSRCLPAGSIAVVYDCFGAGKYRNRSEPRHRYRDALVQISNELAALGLCESLIASKSEQDDAFLRAFNKRVVTAVLSLRRQHPDAVLVLFIDAADNAEMAANEFSEACFAHQLLREQLPSGVKLVELCRTERIDLLKPQSSVIKIELRPFTYNETRYYIKQHYPNISEGDCREFHRLTAGNPRVQANALEMGCTSISDILDSLGPSPTTVNDLIKAQLKQAVCKLKEALPESHQGQIDSICLGLSNLPPYIPINVLAVAANVEEAAIKSFVSDLGRPLWVSDRAVQFRDEPTETWFREQFSANKNQVSNFINNIKPLAAKLTYVSEALPALLLQAESYDELVEISLSDDFLPLDNPIDARSIRIYRLQFAFKAALKQKKYSDASILAMRAGEEVAGDNRQFYLLKKNVDLIAPLQSEQRVQELSFRRSLRGSWQGSENVYSAALLSSIPELHGEARSFLRASENWLRIYFSERDKNSNDRQEDMLRDEEIVELAYSHFLLYGCQETIQFIMSWRPPEVVQRVASALIKRLVDGSEFDAINDISLGISSDDTIRFQYFCLAITDELWKVIRTPQPKVLRACLDLLLKEENRLLEPTDAFGEKGGIPGLLSFAEACAYQGLSRTKIKKLLKTYTVRTVSYAVRDEFRHHERYEFLRGVALDAVLSGNTDIDIETLLPKAWIEKEKEQNDSQELRQFRELVGGLLPWHMVRAKLIARSGDNLDELIEVARQKSSSARTQRWREHDTIPYEISRIRFELLALHPEPQKSTISAFIELLSAEDNKFWLKDLLEALRTTCRTVSLKPIRDPIEQRSYHLISASKDDTPEDRADGYIALARAVLPLSKPDAAAYFDRAFDAVSKFGDEMVERWEAVASIARRYAQSNETNQELAYRFIRCAELIGEHVAREKYIDRDGAVEICAMISPETALSSLSRWRERDVGWFDRQLPALITKLTGLGILSPSVAWSFSAFDGCKGNGELASWCLSNEIVREKRKYILDTAVRDLLRDSASKKELNNLRIAASNIGITNTDLNMALEYYDSIGSENVPSKPPHRTGSYGEKAETDTAWEAIFDGLDVTSIVGINEAINRFDKLPPPRHPESFWKELYLRIDADDAYYFLQSLVEAESADRYDVENALEQFPGTWRKKASVRKMFPNIIRAIARRFATDYTNHYALTYFINKLGSENYITNIRQGVIEGLIDLSDFLDASTFFGFSRFSTEHISPPEARRVLDYSLSRFELHVDDEFGDGAWGPWLYPPRNVVKTVAGFIWAALGAPRSEVRWEAVHCVRRLAELGCVDEMDALVEWMNCGEAGSFVCKRYPFYFFHAKQYLLIAFARISIDDPVALLRHYGVFLHIALDGPPHALIQKLAADIALYIEDKCPNTYSSQYVTELSNVCVTEYPIESVDSYQKQMTSPWHESGNIDTTQELYFGHDFDRYWFEPLGNVFGITSKQVEELARDLVINDWKIPARDKFIDDPRSELWRARRHERETWHSHGSYPLTDSYSFYISYHAMLSIAQKLLKNMPVVRRSEWNDNEWDEWIHRHSLSRADGRWLADRRDPPPLEQRYWITEKRTDEWRWEILADDFLDGLLRSANKQTWIVVDGYWNECDDARNENYSISSALVSPDTSEALLNALSTCSNPMDFKLPDYMEDRMEIGRLPFELKGWIFDEHPDKRLDDNDPHAGDIRYPPPVVGNEIIERMGLNPDGEKRFWYLGASPPEKVLQCELWGDKDTSERDRFVRKGQRLSASLSFLEDLCIKLKKSLIIEVQVNRSVSRFYSRDEDEDIRYPLPYSKVYIFTEDGVLRDTTTSYQLRETAG